MELLDPVVIERLGPPVANRAETARNLGSITGEVSSQWTSSQDWLCD